MSDLKAWREARKPKLSQAGLAAMLDTTQSHVSEIENAEDSISLETAGKIFAITGVRLGLMKGASPQDARAVSRVVGAA